MTTIEAIPHVIKRLRVEAGFSQRQMAIRMGLLPAQRTYVSKLEGKISTPGIASLERVAKALNVTVSSIIQQAERYAGEVSRGVVSLEIVQEKPKLGGRPIKLPPSVFDPNAIERRRKLAREMGVGGA